ncbi:hypothetical protein AKO1_004867 [Acrasis kona]|uniref:PAS domain-containing protein n=1 Tax=Acrasis kona TaxID=1008807 RepID=A0AAW2Z4S3_9EUKA
MIPKSHAQPSYAYPPYIMQQPAYTQVMPYPMHPQHRSYMHTLPPPHLYGQQTYPMHSQHPSQPPAYGYVMHDEVGMYPMMPPQPIQNAIQSNNLPIMSNNIDGSPKQPVNDYYRQQQIHQHQQQTQQQQQTIGNDDCQIEISLIRTLLRTSSIAPCAKRTETNGPAYVLYKFLNDDSYTLHFWSLLESLIATRISLTSKPSSTSNPSKSKHSSKAHLSTPCVRGEDGVCYQHSECIKDDLLDKFHSYVRHRMTESRDKEQLSNCPYLIMQQQDKADPVVNDSIMMHCPHLQKFAENTTDHNHQVSVRNILDDSNSTHHSPSTSTSTLPGSSSLQNDSHSELESLPSASSLLNMFPTQIEKPIDQQPGPDELYIRHVLDMCDVGVIVYMYERGDVVLWNNKTAQMLGYNEQDLRARVKTWMDILHPVHLPLDQSRMDDIDVRPMNSQSKTFQVESSYFCQHSRSGEMFKIASHTTNFVEKKFAVLRFDVLKNDSLLSSQSTNLI